MFCKVQRTRPVRHGCAGLSARLNGRIAALRVDVRAGPFLVRMRGSFPQQRRVSEFPGPAVVDSEDLESAGRKLWERKGSSRLLRIGTLQRCLVVLSAFVLAGLELRSFRPQATDHAVFEGSENAENSLPVHRGPTVSSDVHGALQRNENFSAILRPSKAQNVSRRLETKRGTCVLASRTSLFRGIVW